MVDELTRGHVVWNPTAGYRAARRRSRTKSVASVSTKRVKWWIVRAIILGTTLFAILDLYLLVSGSHH